MSSFNFPYCADSLKHAFNEIAKWSRRLSVRRLSISRHKNNTGKLKRKQNDNLREHLGGAPVFTLIFLVFSADTNTDRSLCSGLLFII